MPKTTFTPVSETRTQFRRQCAALGRARDENTIVELVAAFGERLDSDLLVQVWREEETKSRDRKQVPVRTRRWGGLTLILVSLYLMLRLYANYKSGIRDFFSLPPVTVVPGILFTWVTIAADTWSVRRSLVQRGLARLILRRGPTIQDCGFLVDISQFRVKHWEEFNIPAAQALTRLLPAAVQTDTLRLDAHQCGILRAEVARVAQQLAPRKKWEKFVYGVDPQNLSPETADFAAAALLAVNRLGELRGELRGDSKEHRAARAAAQKLADAPAQEGEPLNHRYVREMAKESLPPVSVGRSAP